MGPLARILDGVRSLFGGSGSDGESTPDGETDSSSTASESMATGDAPAVDASESDGEATVRRCPVCGTDVEPDGESCPLCGSTDLASTSGPVADGETTGSPGPDAVATDGEETDDAAGRLRELRGE